MMKLDLDPNSSSKDSAEESKGAAKMASDAGGKVSGQEMAGTDLCVYLVLQIICNFPRVC